MRSSSQNHTDTCFPFLQRVAHYNYTALLFLFAFDVCVPALSGSGALFLHFFDLFRDHAEWLVDVLLPQGESSHVLMDTVNGIYIQSIFGIYKGIKVPQVPFGKVKETRDSVLEMILKSSVCFLQIELSLICLCSRDFCHLSKEGKISALWQSHTVELLLQ